MPRPVPGAAQNHYFAFTPNEMPAVPQVSQQEDSAILQGARVEYQIPEQARSRHILIKVASGADQNRCRCQGPKPGAAKQIQGGANFADLAKKNSDDPGSKTRAANWALPIAA